jgi:hypothetical protein
MKTYKLYARMIGAALILLAASSASDAGWFRGGGRCYYDPAYPTPYAATSPAPAPTAAPASSGPVVRQANKPAIGVEALLGAPPAATNYAPKCVPGTMSGGGWSVIPRSSSDFGRFPPYR